MSSSRKFLSDTMLTRPHIHPSPARISTHSTHSRKISSTLVQYAPLSTSSSSTLFEYASLSSTMTTSYSSSDYTTTSSLSARSSTRSLSSAFTSHLTTSTASIGLAPSTTGIADSGLSAHSGFSATDPHIGFAVAVLILLGLLLVMATTMWLTESKDCQASHRLGCEKRKPMSEARIIAEPVGLGIILQPAIVEREGVRGTERLKGWFSTITKREKSPGIIERWINSAVFRARTDLDANAEEGLLLPVQENERIGSEKNQVYIEVDLD